MKQPVLVMMTRYPQPGRAKTRLIPALGADGAAALHRRLTERTLQTMRATGLQVEMWVTGAPIEAFRNWLGDDLTIRLQAPGDLGARIDQASRPGPRVVVGADAPTLAVAHLEQATALVRAGDVALGPAEDGGYYLIGLPTPAPHLFRDMPWSTQTVLGETVRRLEAAATPYGLLPTLPDLDRPEDVERFASLLA